MSAASPHCMRGDEDRPVTLLTSAGVDGTPLTKDDLRRLAELTESLQERRIIFSYCADVYALWYYALTLPCIVGPLAVAILVVLWPDGKQEVVRKTLVACVSTLVTLLVAVLSVLKLQSKMDVFNSCARQVEALISRCNFAARFDVDGHTKRETAQGLISEVKRHLVEIRSQAPQISMAMEAKGHVRHKEWVRQLKWESLGKTPDACEAGKAWGAKLAAASAGGASGAVAGPTLSAFTPMRDSASGRSAQFGPQQSSQSSQPFQSQPSAGLSPLPPRTTPDARARAAGFVRTQSPMARLVLPPTVVDSAEDVLNAALVTPPRATAAGVGAPRGAAPAATLRQPQFQPSFQPVAAQDRGTPAAVPSEPVAY